MESKHDELVRLLIKTARAHHTAYEDVGGYHPEWAEWYAEKMHEEFENILGRPISDDGVAELLVRFDELHAEEAADEKWPHYYARKLLDFYQS